MKKILFSFLGILALGLTACQVDSTETDPNPGPTPGGESGGTLTMNIKAPWTPINTYAPVITAEGENDIYSLHMVFFEQTSTGNGAYMGFYSLDIDENDPLNMEVPVTIDFAGTPLSESEAYNICLVANLDYYLSTSDFDQWKTDIQGLTENELIASTRAYVTGESNQNVYTTGHENPLLMSGTAFKDAGDATIDVLLERTVARFDIVNEAKTKYDLKSASIWNGFPYSSIWDGGTDYSSASARIERYYGITSSVDGSGYYKNIEGGLYSFENQVAKPGANDKMTTCLIIGLADRTTSKTLYYRINVASPDNGQQLKRNNSYIVTIREIIGKGYNTEREAYEGGGEGLLNVVINYWNLDNDGMIKYDGENVLAVPMKRINIPRAGDEREYSIFTLGSGSLNISRNTLPTGITAKLTGNMLTVNATAMGDAETARNGEIDLTFGNLTATVIVYQGGEVGQYLTVSPTELPSFQAYNATQSSKVTVSSSGSWKAKIYNPGFSFAYGSSVTEISSATHPDGFTVSTTGANDDNITRFGFAIVTLDENPDVSRTIILKQLAQSSISLSPEQDYIRFNPDGSLISGSNNVFAVNPGDDGAATINGWGVVLGDNANFSIIENHSTTSLSGNNFTVIAKGSNLGSATYNTTVKVYLLANPAISKTMPVTQGAYNFSVSQTAFEAIPASGGSTPAITVNAPAGMTWSATVTTTTSDHKAYLTTSASSSPVYQLSGRSLSESLYVSFPAQKNPNVTPVATVTVTLDGTSLSVTFNVTQSNLVPRGLQVQSTGTSYGTAIYTHSGYKFMSEYWANMRNWRNFGKEEASVVKTAGGIAFTSGKTPLAGTTIYHSNQTACSSTYMSQIHSWMKRDHRNFMTIMVSHDHAAQQQMLRYFSSQFTVKATGIATSTRKSLTQTPGAYRQNKIWEYLTETGPFCNGTPVNLSSTSFYNGDACNGVLTSWPSTTIPIMVNPTNSSQVILAIDPVHKLLIFGDEEIFSNRNSASNKSVFTEGSDNWKFLNNLIAFVVNSSQYGDAFLNQFK